MSVPPPLAPTAAALGDQALPVLETTVEQDHGPRSPTSPELIDRGLKRRGMLESSVFSLVRMRLPTHTLRPLLLAMLPVAWAQLGSP